MSRTKLITLLFTIIVVLSLAALYLVVNRPGETRGPINSSFFEAGPFETVDHTGKTVTEKDYLGFKKLVFFGFTNCPAICPTELSNIALAVDELTPEQAKKLKVLFVSIDPEYDTPQIMKEYIEAFNDDFVGLVGSVEQTAKMAKTFRVYYAKIPDSESEIGYTMDHSAYSYFVDEDNKTISPISFGDDFEKLAKMLKENL